MNEITLIGTIDRDSICEYKRYGILMNSFDLLCERNSGIIDTICVIAQKDTIPDSDYVRVDGFVQTENYKSEDGEKHLNVYIFALSIQDTSSEPYNKGSIKGRICKVAPVRTTPNGRVIEDFIIAINNGTRSYYIPCIAWEDMAYEISLLGVGTDILVTGRIQSRNYIKCGNTKRTYEFSVEEYSVT